MHVRTCICMYVRTYVCMYVHNSLFYVCVAITVKFNQSAYNVTENSGIIQLFLVLSSPSSFIETVQLITNNVDTDGMINCQNIHMLCTYKYILCFIIKGGGVDYNSGPYTVTFPIRSANASFDITIIDDNVFEFDEMFSISITSITNGHIVGTPAVATVTIIDTTSKCVHNLIFMYVCTYICT